jgi:hypothetical protein
MSTLWPNGMIGTGSIDACMTISWRWHRDAVNYSFLPRRYASFYAQRISSTLTLGSKHAIRCMKMLMIVPRKDGVLVHMTPPHPRHSQTVLANGVVDLLC